MTDSPWKQYDADMFESVELSPRSLAPRVIAALKSSPNLGRLDVRGTMGLSESVSKFDTLTFDDRAILVLEPIEVEFIGIAVNEIILDIRNPYYKAFISRLVGSGEDRLIEQLHGRDGARGSNGRDGSGEVSRNGRPGEPGAVGEIGAEGLNTALPPVFVFVQKITFGTEGTPSKQYFEWNFRGLTGGDGGDGGDGGNGGNGAPGKKGASGGFHCRAGAGRGGDGGAAGQGGRGGDAADGGPGATIFLHAPDRSIFDFTTTTIEGGAPGTPGSGGRPGMVGRGARGGPSNPPCKSGKRGHVGGVPQPPTQGTGSTGIQGPRGQLFTISRNNSDLF